MTIKYVGPKPIISHTGIEFDTNKEDKYSYLSVVLQLIKALDHDYFQDKVYKYTADSSEMKADELEHEFSRYCPNLKALMDTSNHNVEDEIQHNIQRAHESATLVEEEKTTLENNLHIMHDYLIQRSINKSVYYNAINVLAELLRKDHIDYIIVPMLEKYAHVLHSVQGVLLKGKFPIDTKINIYQEEDKLLVKLQVINI